MEGINAGTQGSIDWNKPVQTKDGQSVRILCIDGPHSLLPVIGILGKELSPRLWRKCGQYLSAPTHMDLINVPPKKCKGWINIYQYITFYSLIHPSKMEADMYQSKEAGRIACIQIEYFEGEGLNVSP